ncbi:MAG: type II toxin-antitoxin system YoeB family toxin [Tunicatimonas sp.]
MNRGRIVRTGKAFWSRRISLEHRLIYQVHENEILIAKCRFHYE